MWIWYILICALGFVSGILATTIFWRTKTTFGVLRIDKSNSEKDLYRLEIGDLDELQKKSQVVLKVDISHQ